MKLSIIIPVFNEEKTIERVIRKVASLQFDPDKKEVIVVNDASTDQTAKILLLLSKKIKGLHIINHSTNQGKGAAVRSGFKKASGDYVVIQDADLEYDPSYLFTLFKPIQQGKTDVVFGTRLKRPPHVHEEESHPRFMLHYFGNRLLSFLTSILYLQWITDMETCYKLFPLSFAKETKIKGDGFNFEPEVTAKLIKAGYKIMEIPIKTYPRGYDEGKKLQTFPEGVKALVALVKYRFVD